MNIVIVGGGTAGWLSALSLYDKHNVTLIESDIPTIGVGESTTDYVIGWLKEKLDINDFHSKTNSTIKLGVQFHNWTNSQSTYFHLFGDIEGKIPKKFDDVVRYCFQNNIDINGLSVFKEIVNNTTDWDNVATHWDSVTVPNYIRNKLAGKINYVQDTVNSVVLDNNHVVELQLKNQNLTADLYIDCTGFRKLLTSNTNNKWINWNQPGQVDRALVWQMPHTDEIPLYTQSEAWNYGWRWKIPTRDRLGNGYVFDSDFVSEQDAEKEIRERTGYTDSLRLIKFNPGMIENVYYNNIVSLGLSSHFLEPLEATNFDFLVYNLQNLDLVLENKLNIEQFNDKAKTIVQSIRKFVKLHYITDKSDTEFWKIQQQELCREIIDAIQNGQTTSNLAPGLFTDYNWYKVAQGIELKSKKSNNDPELLARYQLASI